MHQRTTEAAVTPE